MNWREEVDRCRGPSSVTSWRAAGERRGSARREGVAASRASTSTKRATALPRRTPRAQPPGPPSMKRSEQLAASRVDSRRRPRAPSRHVGRRASMRPSCWRRITTAAVVAPPSVAAAAPAFSQRRGDCLRAPRAEPQGAPRRRLEADRAPVRLDQRSPQARTSSPAALQCRCQRIRSRIPGCRPSRRRWRHCSAAANGSGEALGSWRRRVSSSPCGRRAKRQLSAHRSRPTTPTA